MTETQHSADRIVRIHGLRAWCANNPGWRIEGKILRKSYAFADASEAPEFACRSIARATRSGTKLAIFLDKTSVELIVEPAGEEFTTDELTAARRYDITPGAPASATKQISARKS